MLSFRFHRFRISSITSENMIISKKEQASALQIEYTASWFKGTFSYFYFSKKQ